ncbi:Putative THO complex, subunitTHOC2, THO complex subunit 2 domain-containing protein [Septoria linicola]|uniref:THO complex subunit 2 n=1 Tax=Septoria linicola TaxID=215465 RepID=A0A9Q9ASA0_9PEZI|nr:putative THO complex, subunitTHOC2, THO complex subunit 2 domain-containing protein [Septoria linicola]USW51117.1 Putative THO complex, subunitTHOC2, THO complex subunit 2 domain-containing protein [Septoria linicola]
MPAASGKRKRPERQHSDDASRASPYRPEKSRMASRRTSKGSAVAEEGADESEPTAATTPASGYAQDVTHLEPPAESGDTPVPGTTPIANGEASMDDVSVEQRPPYHYTYISDEDVAAWSGTGSQNIVETATKLNDIQLSDLLQELVRSALDGRLTGQQAGHCVRNLIAAQRNDGGPDVEFLFLNGVSFLFEAGHKGAALKDLLAGSGIDQQTLRLELDIPLLQELGLVRSTFDKMKTRKTTNALYRQANFNLLREESEGYAKLITEYFNTAQQAFARRDEVNAYIAEDAFQRVKALVGAFDLDVGRVLDITLDVSADLLVKAYPFFMKFYRASSWWPSHEPLDNLKWEDQGFGSLPTWCLPGSGRSAFTDEEREHLATLRQARDVRFWQQVRESGVKAFYELGARKIVDFDAALPLLEQDAPPELDARGKETNPNKRQRVNEDRKFARETRHLPPPGNYDAAQLLGFKLRFYASDARDPDDALPDNLIYLTALLIKIGFVSLRDIYPHLYPADGDMAAEKKRLEKEKAEKEAKDRPGGGMNALLAAGALPDDAPVAKNVRLDANKSGGATPAQEKKDEAAPVLPAPTNQKIFLLKALLLIGALPEALYILGRFPWLAEADNSLPPFLFRIVRHMLGKMTASMRPLLEVEHLRQTNDRLSNTTVQSNGQLPVSTWTVKKPVRWLHNDSFTDSGEEYRHYYSDWSDNIPICQTSDDVYSLCDTFIGFLGPKIGQNAEIFGTLLRLAEQNLTGDSSADNRARWLNLLRRLLVPALSCGQHNPQRSQQVFDLLKLYPLSTRYSVYAEWFSGPTSRQADVRNAFARNRAEVRDVLRRVSNDTVRKQGRALGKVSLAAPGIVMTEMISQLEVYANMIPSLVECTRYFSPMAYEVLTWALINSLSGNGRNRMQADGMLTSPWLQALSRFVANLFAKYTYLNPSPILQYLASKLRVGETTDLEMFEQILVEMAGIRADVEFNDTQVLAMAGGISLQSYILEQLSDRRHTKEKEKPARRLVQCLSNSGLVGQLLIAMAQDRRLYAHGDELRYAPLKVVGNNLDKISAVFAQYLDALKWNLKPQELEAAVPEVGALVEDFGIEPSVALVMRRMAIRARMNDHDVAKKQDADKKEKTDTSQTHQSGDVVMEGSQSKAEGDADDVQDEAEVKPDGTEDTSTTLHTPLSPWHPVLEPVIEQLAKALPDLASRLSIPFYVTFWTLTHQDVLVPTDSYQKETNRIEMEIKQINADRSDVTSIVAKERDARKRTLQKWYDSLKSEPMQHMAAYMAVRNRISGSKIGNKIIPGENAHWFPKSDSTDQQHIKAENDAKHQALLQDCFLPRAMLSAIDSHFSFEMLKLMHTNGTPGFSLMHLLYQLFKKKQLTSLIFACTQHEAQHLARFLWEVLKLLHRWHADKATYEKEALGLKRKLPGFVRVFEDNGEPKLVMDWELFRKMLFNIHAALNAALQACFESGEYMHIRNGMTVLKGIHQVFPALKFMGKNMVDQIERLSKEEPRSDLKLSAMSLRGPIRSREKQWVMPQAFRLGEGVKEAPKPGGRSSSSARPETPQPGSAKLNASAPDFKPSLANGSSRKESAVEDGEIEDEKLAAAKAAGTVSTEKLAEKRLPSRETPKPFEPRASRPSAARDAPRNDSKPTTPAPSHIRSTPHPSIPHRPESRDAASRSESARPPRDLPARPEQSAYNRPLPEQAAPRNPSRYGERPEEHYGRLDRGGDTRPVSRDQSPSHRNARGRTPPGAASRASYREERPYERAGSDSRYARDEQHSSRRDVPSHHSRDVERPAQSSRASDSGVHPDRLGHLSSVAVTPDSHRAPPSVTSSASARQPEQVSVNPARLALINQDSPATGSPRSNRDRSHGDHEQRRDRGGRPDDHSGPPQFQPRSDSRSSGRLTEPSWDGPARSEPQQDLAPRGPRARGGRLQEMPPPAPESTYGRLNAPADPPSGPKNGPAGRSGRNFTAPQPGTPSAPSPTTARMPEQSAPRGPSRQSSGPTQHTDRTSAPNSAPSTPATENGPTVHPSRLAHLGQQPSPIQTAFAPNGPRNGSSGSPMPAAPPSAPRGPGRNGSLASTPTGPAPAANVPPSGPATPAERQHKNRQRDRINATLTGSGGQQQSGQGVQFRGASSRQSSISGAPPMGTAMAPPAAPSSESFQARPERSDERSHRQRDDGRPPNSRHSSRERPHNESSFGPGFAPPPPSNAVEERGRRDGPRDGRQTRDERLRDGPRADPRGVDRQQQPRMEESHSRRSYGSGSFNGPPQGQYQNDQRQAGNVRMVPAGPQADMRAGPPRREEDRREQGGRGMMREDGGPQGGQDARKRRHEESQQGFDPSKRRRSGRP